MNKEIIILEEKQIEIPKIWDYNKSVKLSKNLFKEVREKGSTALYELRIAHEILIEDSKKKIGRKYLDKTFEGYCDDIEIDVKTARNWLHRYFPKYLPMGEISLIPRIPTKDITLIEGDVLKVDIPEVDVVFTDPPYNVTGIEWDIIGTDKEYIDFTKKWIKRLKWRNHFFVFCSPKYIADYEIILRELNYPIKSRIIWVHKNMSMGKDTKDKFINCYDVVFHCGKTELNLPKVWTDERFDVKEFANPQTNFKDIKLHQTQKPKELISELLRLSTKQGDSVLDCFAGSGSTGLSASELGLKCYLIEKEPNFIKLIKEHLCI